MRNNITINYPCPNCDGEYKITVSPIIPAKIHGPPEDCYPAEGGEFEPEKCPNCEHPASDTMVWRLMEDEIQAQEEAHADDEYERRKERYE